MSEFGPQQDGPERTFAFDATPAVLTARARRRFVDCSICGVDHSQYLFHRRGIRYVRCRSCGVVYVNPGDEVVNNTFDLDRLDHLPGEAELMAGDFDRLVERLEAEYQRRQGRPLQRALLVGKFMRAFAESSVARRAGLTIAEITDDALHDIAVRSDIGWLKPFLDSRPEVVVLHELLEACSDPGAVVGSMVDALPASTWFVVSYTNASSLPARVMRRHSSAFFRVKTTFLDTGHLGVLFARHGFEISAQFPLPKRHTLTYLGRNLVSEGSGVERVLTRSRVGTWSTPLRIGDRVAVFRRNGGTWSKREKVTIVMPVYNEALYCADVIEAVLAKELAVDKELVIVESNSRDGTREIVERFRGRPGVELILEDRPRGKGHAVRAGLKAASGTIVIIQDADFEYDIDDYDALLEPILQHKTHFVLGSRTLGLDDWKVRQFGQDRLKGSLMNAAQVVFASTYNLLYQQKVTDVNTMFKVFRRTCLDQFELESDGFELDIELACKLARTGYAPMEVPVNYVARSFAEGKKIRFFHDFFRSYSAFVKYRFQE
jgi:Glycosyl transferase family 2